MQYSCTINKSQEQHISEESKNSAHNSNSKVSFAEEMENTIKSLSNELNEARKILRQKKQVLDIQFSTLENEENNPKREYQEFMEKMSVIGRQTYETNLTSNQTKLKTYLNEIENKKTQNPKVKLSALKQLLSVVNKINKTYDPIRI